MSSFVTTRSAVRNNPTTVTSWSEPRYGVPGWNTTRGGWSREPSGFSSVLASPGWSHTSSSTSKRSASSAFRCQWAAPVTLGARLPLARA